MTTRAGARNGIQRPNAGPQAKARRLPPYGGALRAIKFSRLASLRLVCNPVSDQRERRFDNRAGARNGIQRPRRGNDPPIPRRVATVSILPRRFSSDNAARFGKGVFSKFDFGGDLNACQACALTERALADGRYGIRNLNLRCVFYSVEGFEKPARECETGSSVRTVVRRLKPDGFPPAGARFAR